MNNKRYLLYLLIIFMIISISGCKAIELDNTLLNTSKNRITVAVSIVPQETFVKAVAGDLVDVTVMIPPGNSPANYQPTPKQMIKFSQSKIYFSIGVPTEEVNIMPTIKDFNNNIKVISLADKVGEVYPYRNSGEGRDPHIWLSPKRVKVMIELIRDELIKLDPDNRSTYEKNANEYIEKLNRVDNEIKAILDGFEQQSFIIYHPSFGYFADDYGLNMITVEEEGKEATVKRLQEVIDYAKKENIKIIFFQEEFDSQQAETIAKEIGGAAIKVSPLALNYIENLEFIAQKLKEVLR